MSTSEEDIKAVAREFYNALNDLFTGDVTPMDRVWSHADDVCYLGPRGEIVTGWKAIYKELKKQADLKMGGIVKPEEMHVTICGDIAITQNREVGSNVLDGNSFQVDIRATNIFRKEQGLWKMISHHTDIIPDLQATH